MTNLTYALKERIGDPSLFCGRKEEMALLLDWAGKIPREISKSRVLLGRRKSGKTAIMQRLFNILWNESARVVPFYFEVLDFDQWVLDFADKYFRTFMSQFLSFKTRTPLSFENKPWKMNELEDMGRAIKNENVLKAIEEFQEYYDAEREDAAITLAFQTPGWFAGLENIFVLVMVDEIQYMTKHIYWDKEKKVKAHNLPGAYHGLVESKVAPMLVSGSYIGWMVQMMRDMFVGGRLKQTPVSPKLTFTEGMEAVYRYAEYYGVPITDESAFAINALTQSDPFYIATLFRSDWPKRNFTTIEGASNTLAYEIKNKKGELYGTWSEYIDNTIKQVNDTHAKKILLFLSRERHKEVTRTEISDFLGGKLENGPLEEKLRTLEYGGLLTRGTNDFRFSGIPDDILDLIFRERYQEEIDNVKPDVNHELSTKIKSLEKDNKFMQGALNELKGRMLEFVVYREFNRCKKEGKKIKNFKKRVRPLLNERQAHKMQEVLNNIGSSKFDNIWMNYFINIPGAEGSQELDVVAEGADAGKNPFVLVFEMKNRDETHSPTMDEAKSFLLKVHMFKQDLEQKNKITGIVCPVYLSAKGFNRDVEMWLHEHLVLTSDMKHWFSYKND
jgi:hypothetical protein